MTIVLENTWDNWNLGQWLLFAIIGMLLVILILAIIFVVNVGISKGLDQVEKKFLIKPREENKLLEEDKDAVVALLVATIDFEKETNKDSNLKSIQRID